MHGTSKLHHLNAWEHRSPRCATRVLPTGLRALDEMLPGGGWPKVGVVEVTAAADTALAMELFMPLLARLTREGRRVVLVVPPYAARSRVFSAAAPDPVRVMQVNPHPGRSVLWTVESLLHTGDYGTVMAWPGCNTELMDKRLQRAAREGKSLCVLFRPVCRRHSPCGIQLRLEVEVTGRALYLLDSAGDRLAGIAWEQASG